MLISSILIFIIFFIYLNGNHLCIDNWIIGIQLNWNLFNDQRSREFHNYSIQFNLKMFKRWAFVCVQDMTQRRNICLDIGLCEIWIICRVPRAHKRMHSGNYAINVDWNCSESCLAALYSTGQGWCVRFLFSSFFCNSSFCFAVRIAILQSKKKICKKMNSFGVKFTFHIPYKREVK